MLLRFGKRGLNTAAIKNWSDEFEPSLLVWFDDGLMEFTGAQRDVMRRWLEENSIDPMKAETVKTPEIQRVGVVAGQHKGKYGKAQIADTDVLLSYVPVHLDGWSEPELIMRGYIALESELNPPVTSPTVTNPKAPLDGKRVKVVSVISADERHYIGRIGMAHYDRYDSMDKVTVYLVSFDAAGRDEYEFYETELELVTEDPVLAAQDHDATVQTFEVGDEVTVCDAGNPFNGRQGRVMGIDINRPAPYEVHFTHFISHFSFAAKQLKLTIPF